MEAPKGKEILSSDRNEQIDLSHNSILRPYKIQKLDIPHLFNGKNQEPGSTSYGDHQNKPTFHTTLAYEIPEDYQTTSDQDIGGDNMNSEGPFSCMKKRYWVKASNSAKTVL